jgi:hypothetical protein
LTTRRIALGDDRPDECFVWWINARRLQVEVDADRLRRRVNELFEQHWPLRMNRGIMANAGDVVLPLPRGSRGVVKSTLPFLMGPGEWKLSATLASGAWSDISGLSLDIVTADETVLHRVEFASATIENDTASWTIQQPFVSFALSLRIVVDDVNGDVALALPIQLARNN